MDGSAAHQNASSIPVLEGSVGVFADPLAFAEGDDATPGSRTEPHSVFKQVVALITGLFPDAHPSIVKPSDPASWFCGFGDEKQRDPKVFLSCFDRIRSIMADVEERSMIAAQGRKKAINVLLSWGEIYRLSDFPTFAKAPPVNDQFSRLLDKQLSSSRHVSLSLEECSHLENCVRGLVESQSYSSWVMAAVFAFLREEGMVPEDESFHRLVSGLSVVLNSQAKASLSAASFLKQKRRETYVSHLPSSTHESVRQALLSSPSDTSLFSDDVITKSLSQVKDDSQILLKKNLSSQRGGKGSASSASSSTQRRPKLRLKIRLSPPRGPLIVPRGVINDQPPR